MLGFVKNKKLRQDQEKVSFLKCFSFIPEKFKAGLGMKIIVLIDCRYRHYVTYA